MCKQTTPYILTFIATLAAVASAIAAIFTASTSDKLAELAEAEYNYRLWNTSYHFSRQDAKNSQNWDLIVVQRTGDPRALEPVTIVPLYLNSTNQELTWGKKLVKRLTKRLDGEPYSTYEITDVAEGLTKQDNCANCTISALEIIYKVAEHDRRRILK